MQGYEKNMYMWYNTGYEKVAQRTLRASARFSL